MKKIMEKTNKKVAVVALAGVLSFGALGGGAYAYKDAWTAKIQSGVSALAGYIYKDDITNAINAHNETLKGELKGFISSTVNSATKALQDHKKAEIKRGKKSLSDKLAEDKARAKEVVDNAVASEKTKQEAKTDTQVNTDAGELDAIVESELAKIPNSN